MESGGIITVVIRMEVLATDLLKSAGDQVDAIRRELIRELSHEGNEILKLFEQTIQHWDKSKFDKFKKTSKVTPNEATVTVGTDDRIYAFINYGTSERWALLSSNWKSQTAVRSLNSTQGQGRVLLRGKRAMQKVGLQAFDGIDARHFDEEIVKKRQPIFVRNLEASVIAVTKSIT
jgi:hypothetical protein